MAGRRGRFNRRIQGRINTPGGGAWRISRAAGINVNVLRNLVQEQRSGQ